MTLKVVSFLWEFHFQQHLFLFVFVVQLLDNHSHRGATFGDRNYARDSSNKWQLLSGLLLPRFTPSGPRTAPTHRITPLARWGRRGEWKPLCLSVSVRRRAAALHLAEDVGRRLPDVCHRDRDSSPGYHRRESQRGVLPRLAGLPGRVERRLPVSGEDRRRGRDHLLREMRAALLLLQHGRAAGSGQLR